MVGGGETNTKRFGKNVNNNRTAAVGRRELAKTKRTERCIEIYQRVVSGRIVGIGTTTGNRERGAKYTEYGGKKKKKKKKFQKKNSRSTAHDRNHFHWGFSTRRALASCCRCRTDGHRGARRDTRFRDTGGRGSSARWPTRYSRSTVCVRYRCRFETGCARWQSGEHRLRRAGTMWARATLDDYWLRRCCESPPASRSSVPRSFDDPTAAVRSCPVHVHTACARGHRRRSLPLPERIPPRASVRPVKVSVRVCVCIVRAQLRTLLALRSCTDSRAPTFRGTSGAQAEKRRRAPTARESPCNDPPIRTGCWNGPGRQWPVCRGFGRKRVLSWHAFPTVPGQRFGQTELIFRLGTRTHNTVSTTVIIARRSSTATRSTVVDSRVINGTHAPYRIRTQPYYTAAKQI